MPSRHTGEKPDSFRLRRNAYMRDWMRRQRNSTHLTDIEEEAVSRRMATADLITKMLKIIARDDLFAAILDGEE